VIFVNAPHGCFDLKRRSEFWWSCHCQLQCDRVSISYSYYPSVATWKH